MYKIRFKDEVDNDLSKLDQSIKDQVFKKLRKISINPQVGENLTGELAGFKKVYVARKKIRIVYKVIDDKIEILVIAIGKRENKLVYKSALNRLNNKK